jgi:CysZ protein
MIARFFSGMGFFARGWRLAFAGGGLTVWVLMPALVAGVVTAGGTWATWHYLGAWLDRHGGGHGFGAWIAWILRAVVALMTAYALYAASCVLATAPFAGALSERAEHHATGTPVPPQSWGRAIVLSLRGAGQALLGVSAYLAIALVLFVLHWVAVPLAPFLWVASLLQTALFFAFDAFNEPLHRRGAGFGQKWRFIGTHLAESLGFGLAVALLMMVPLVSIVVAPVAVVGGTLLHLELTKNSRTALAAALPGKKDARAGV